MLCHATLRHTPESTHSGAVSGRATGRENQNESIFAEASRVLVRILLNCKIAACGCSSPDEATFDTLYKKCLSQQVWALICVLRLCYRPSLKRKSEEFEGNWVFHLEQLSCPGHRNTTSNPPDQKKTSCLRTRGRSFAVPEPSPGSKVHSLPKRWV